MTLLVGTLTGGANVDSFASNELPMWMFTAAATGSVSVLWCNPGAAPGAGMTSVDLAIYADNGAGTNPAGLLGFGTYNSANPAGVFGVKLSTPVAVTLGTKYWLAVNPHGGIFNTRESSGPSYYTNTGSNTTPPSTAPARSSTGSGGLAIWGDDSSSPITADFCTGFEHGLLPQTGALFGFNAVPSGSVWSIQTGTPRHGSYCLRHATPGSLGGTLNRSLVSPAPRAVARIGFRFISLPSAGIASFFEVFFPAVTLYFSVDLNGVIQGQFITQGGAVQTGPNVGDGNWHFLEVSAYAGSSLMPTDWKVDGVAQTQIVEPSAQTTGNVTAFVLGHSQTSLQSYTVEWDDFVCGTAPASNIWFGDGKTLSYMPGSDGTHSFTTGDFSPGDAGTTQAPSWSTAWQNADPAPPWSLTRSTTANVAQRVVRTTAYVELVPVANSETQPANAVVSHLSYSSSGTAGNTAGCIVRNSAGFAGVLFGDLPTAQGGNGGALTAWGSSTNLTKTVGVSKPASDWTSSEVNAVRWRFGGGGDVNPIPTVQGLMIEVDWQTAPTVPNITGTSAGAGATTGALTAAPQLSGSAAGVSAITASLTATSKLSGTTTGTGAATGVVTIPAFIVGIAAGAGTTTGALKASPQISGTSAGTGVTTGAVGGQPKVGGTTAGIGATIGSLTATSKLTGSADAVGNTTGALTATSKLIGTTAGTSTLTGQPTTPTGVPADLVGTTSGTSTLTGAVTITAILSGTTAGVSTTTGSLIAPPVLSGTAAGNSATTGALTAQPKLSGAAASTGSTTGALTATSLLSGASAAIGTTTGALTAQPKLNGTSAATSTTTGALTATSLLSGSAVGNGALTGAVSVPGLAVLAGTTAGVGTVTGTVLVTLVLAGTAAGFGATTGAVTAQSQLSGTAAATSTTTGALTAQPKLSGTINGISTTTGALTATALLSGALPGIGGLSGGPFVPGLANLGGTVSGVGTTSGALSATALLSGTSAGVSTTTGSVKAPPALFGSVVGVSTTTGSLKTQPQVAGSSNGNSTTAGTLKTSAQVVGFTQGFGLMTGVFAFSSRISGNAVGVGSLSGTLVALRTAQPIFPLNTSGHIETAHDGALETANVGVMIGVGANGDVIESGNTGTLTGPRTGSVR